MFHRVYKLKQTVPVNLTFIISSESLDWTKHAKERFRQRSVMMPKGRHLWTMIERSFSVEHNCVTMNLKLDRNGLESLILVVAEQNGRYKVITTYWDEDLV